MVTHLYFIRALYVYLFFIDCRLYATKTPSLFEPYRFQRFSILPAHRGIVSATYHLLNAVKMYLWRYTLCFYNFRWFSFREG